MKRVGAALQTPQSRRHFRNGHHPYPVGPSKMLIADIADTVEPLGICKPVVRFA